MARKPAASRKLQVTHDLSRDIHLALSDLISRLDREGAWSRLATAYVTKARLYDVEGDATHNANCLALSHFAWAKHFKEKGQRDSEARENALGHEWSEIMRANAAEELLT